MQKVGADNLFDSFGRIAAPLVGVSVADPTLEQMSQQRIGFQLEVSRFQFSTLRTAQCCQLFQYRWRRGKIQVVTKFLWQSINY